MRTPLLASRDLPPVLGVRAMVGLVFFEVSGGPFGAEPVVRLAGPFAAVLGFLLIPLVWSVPIALLTAELCSEDAHVGGKIHFVHKMWGPWVGWYNGWFNAVSNVFDVATLPPMALSYAEAMLGSFTPEVRWWAKFALIGVAVAANIMGIEVVGTASYVLCLVVCAPVLVLSLLGVPRLQLPAAPDWGTIHWLSFLSCLMWNTSGFDDAGATAAEVQGPSSVYPRALGISVVLVSALYVAPLLVGTSVEPDRTLWHSGFLGNVGGTLGGPMLECAIGVAGICSSAAQLNALLCASVREIVCMAEQPGQPVPGLLARLHHSRGTPHLCTLAFGLLLLLTLNHTFVDLINATVFFDCISFLLQFITWIRFRWQTRRLNPAGFRMPIGFAAVVLWSAGPILLSLGVLTFTVVEKGMRGLTGLLMITLVGEFLYRTNSLVDHFKGNGSPHERPVTAGNASK